MVVEKKPPIQATAKITSKGQITLPRAVRERLGLKPGDEVQFVEDESGVHVKRPPKKNRLDKWVGYLAGTNPFDMTDEEYRIYCCGSRSVTTAADADVFFELLGANEERRLATRAELDDLAIEDTIIISELVYAELAGRFPDPDSSTHSSQTLRYPRRRSTGKHCSRLGMPW